MGKFTMVQDDVLDIINKIKGAQGIDLSLIPRNPNIRYYDDNGVCFHESNEANDFYGIRLMIDTQNLLGYYCEVETEWWDENGDYQGSVGEKDFKKFYFNDNGEKCMSELPNDLFNFPFECLMATEHE